jgi:hypothetical protein
LKNDLKLHHDFVLYSLEEAYRSQLKAIIQLSSKSLQESGEATMQLVHQALVGLPVNFIQQEATH